MLRPAKMKHVDLLVLERDVDGVTERLGRLGLLEPTPANPRLSLGDMDVSGRIEQWGLVESRCATLLRETTPRKPSQTQEPPMPLADALAFVEQCEAKAAELRAKQRDLEQKDGNLRAARKDLGAYGPIPAELETLADRSFLHFAIGSIDSRAIERFAEKREGSAILVPFQTDDGEQKLIALTTRKGRWALESELEEVGFVRDTVSTDQKGVPREIMRRIDEALAQMTLKWRDVTDAWNRFWETRAPALVALLRQARSAQQFYRAQANFARTDQMCLISGWAQERALPEIDRALTEATGGRMLMEVHDPEPGEDVPVFMENPRFLKPFERLIAAYGMPGYNEIEPTLFVAVSFLLMFGLMFGDVGQGAVIALAGLLMLRVPRFAEKLGDIGVIFIAAGLSSVFFGFCYGSVFAFENIIPALWIEPLHNIPRIMICAVVLGVAIISLGIVLNVVNCIRRRDYLHAFLDKFGVVGILLYWACLGLLVKHLIVPNDSVTSIELAIVLGLPCVLFFRLPIYNLLTRRKGLFGEGVGMYVMESMVELMETFSGFLANTASFVRISAFALAHAGLSAAIFGLARELWDAPVGGLLATLVVVLGNLFIIFLEGLVVAIQAMRLEYCEFFGKFFRGEGRRFEPFHMAN